MNYKYVIALFLVILFIPSAYSDNHDPFSDGAGDDPKGDTPQTPNEEAIEALGDTGLGPDVSVAGGTTAGDGSSITAISIEGQVGEDGPPLDIADGTIQTGENPCGEGEKHQPNPNKPGCIPCGKCVVIQQASKATVGDWQVTGGTDLIPYENGYIDIGYANSASFDPWLLVKGAKRAVANGKKFTSSEADTILSLLTPKIIDAIGENLMHDLVHTTNDETKVNAKGLTGVKVTPDSIDADSVDELTIGNTQIGDATNINLDGNSITADYTNKITLNIPDINPTTIQEATNLKITGATVTADRIGQVNLGGNLPLIAKDIENVILTTSKSGTKNISFDTTSTTPVLIQNTMNVTRVDIIAIDGIGHVDIEVQKNKVINYTLTNASIDFSFMQSEPLDLSSPLIISSRENNSRIIHKTKNERTKILLSDSNESIISKNAEYIINPPYGLEHVSFSGGRYEREFDDDYKSFRIIAPRNKNYSLFFNKSGNTEIPADGKVNLNNHFLELSKEVTYQRKGFDWNLNPTDHQFHSIYTALTENAYARFDLDDNNTFADLTTVGEHYQVFFEDVILTKKESLTGDFNHEPTPPSVRSLQSMSQPFLVTADENGVYTDTITLYARKKDAKNKFLETHKLYDTCYAECIPYQTKTDTLLAW